MASAKQLAALKKAREARAKKAGVKKVAVSAKSRATGKPPTARLKARRKKNLTAPAGYFPNPVKRKSAPKFVVKVTTNAGKVGYSSDLGTLDTDIKVASKLSEKMAEARAHEIFKYFKKHLRVVEVVPAPK